MWGTGMAYEILSLRILFLICFCESMFSAIVLKLFHKDEICNCGMKLASKTIYKLVPAFLWLKWQVLMSKYKLWWKEISDHIIMNFTVESGENNILIIEQAQQTCSTHWAVGPDLGSGRNTPYTAIYKGTWPSVKGHICSKICQGSKFGEKI